MQLDLTYLPAQDRLSLSIRGKAHWLLTRSLTIRLVSAWVAKLQEVDLPKVGFALGQRDVGQEHALSLEFDGPKNIATPPEPAAQAKLLEEINLTVDALGSKLVFRGQGQEMAMNLTRKESHLLLEMIGKRARDALWLQAVQWPQWLGVGAGGSRG